jgi:ATP-dependent DNA helicase RecG
MVAFANASGGRIFIGVTDDGVIKGIDVTNELKSQMQDMANNCNPPVKILLKTFENILNIEVSEGTYKPYKCASGVFNHLGPNAQKMTHNDIVDFLKSEGIIRFDELINSHFTTEDFSEEKLRFYLQKAHISIILPLPQIIRNLGIEETLDNQVIYNNTL